MRRIAIIIFSISALIYVDYSSKQFMLDFLRSGDMEIWGEWIKLQLSYNSGVAFSLPIRGILLQLITVGIIGGLVWYFCIHEYPKKSKLLDIGYGLIIAGALSHAYERIVFGYVIDFISVKYFAILNFADIFISIGAGLILFYYLFHESER